MYRNLFEVNDVVVVDAAADVAVAAVVWLGNHPATGEAFGFDSKADGCCCCSN